MVPDSLEADKIIRSERRRERHIRTALLLFALGAGVVGFLAALSFARGSIQLSAIPRNFWAVGAAVMFVWVGAGVLGWRSRPGEDRKRLLLRTGQRDKDQRKLGRALVFMPIAALGALPGIFHFSAAILAGHGDSPSWIFAISLAAAVPASLLSILLNTGGAKHDYVFDDELIRSFRAKALETGYLTAMASLVALFSLGLYHATWAVLAAPGALLLCATVPAWTFAWLNWRAEREG